MRLVKHSNATVDRDGAHTFDLGVMVGQPILMPKRYVVSATNRVTGEAAPLHILHATEAAGDASAADLLINFYKDYCFLSDADNNGNYNRYLKVFGIVDGTFVSIAEWK